MLFHQRRLIPNRTCGLLTTMTDHSVGSDAEINPVLGFPDEKMGRNHTESSSVSPRSVPKTVCSNNWKKDHAPSFGSPNCTRRTSGLAVCPGWAEDHRLKGVTNIRRSGRVYPPQLHPTQSRDHVPMLLRPTCPSPSPAIPELIFQQGLTGHPRRPSPSLLAPAGETHVHMSSRDREKNQGHDRVVTILMQTPSQPPLSQQLPVPTLSFSETTKTNHKTYSK